MGAAGRRELLLALAVVAIAGCTPLSPTPPFHFGETPDAMAHGRTALATAVGAGSFDDIGGGVGAAARVRHGLGGGHELRAEAAAIGRINDDEPSDERPWLGKSTALLYKIGWKMGLSTWFAVMAGAGGSKSETGNALGADLAVEIATPKAYFGGRMRPYLGVRGTFAVPVGRDTDEAGGVTKGLVSAGGLALDTSPLTQLFVELGAMGEWNRGYFSTDADPDRMVDSTHKNGGYLAIGATFFFGGRARAPEAPAAAPAE
jgi:hypothetical protein